MYNNVIMVGLGGVGSNLFAPLHRYLSSLAQKPVLTIIDGDTVERSNPSRQSFGSGDITLPKVKALHQQLKQSPIDVFSIASHINVDNVGTIADESLVISAVDNHKTNKMISDHVRTLDNVVYICGTGNLENGNVLVYARQEGVDVLPAITEFHPEIANPTDRHPDEPSCTAVDVGGLQLISTNVTGAMVILQLVSALYNGTAIPAEVFYDAVKFKANPIGPVKTIKDLLTEARAQPAAPVVLQVEETATPEPVVVAS